MKNKKVFIMIILMLITFTLLSACVTTKSVLDKYDGLIGAYQNAQRYAAEGNTCFVLVRRQIDAQTQVFESYLEADVAKTEVYRESLTKFGTDLEQQTNNYYAPDGQAIQPNQLDLGELAQNGATPADMGLSFTLLATAMTEAPLAPIDVTALENTQRIISEQFNLAFSCTADWNDAVQAYNSERLKVSGDIVGTIAEALGVADLPKELPYFMPPANTPSIFDE